MILVFFMIRLGKFFLKPEIAEDQALLNNFIEWYAVVYIFALSLIVGHTWSKYNRTNHTIDREADALALLLHTCKMCKGKRLRTLLVGVIEDYVNCIRILRSEDRRSKPESLEMMGNIHRFVKQMMNNKNVNEFLKPVLIQHYNEFYDARSDRFDLLKQKIHLLVWGVLVLFSLAWLWGFYWLKFCSPALSNFILGCTTFSVAYLFCLARDLDDLESGFWQMNFEPFDSFDSRLIKSGIPS